MWGESTRPTIRLAGRLASSDGGLVVAASFANAEATPPELASTRSLATQAEQWLAKDGLESRTIFRVARTIPEGLLETLLGEDATLLVTEWRQRDRIEPDSEASAALARSPVPTLISHGDVEPFECVLIVVRREDLVRPGSQDVQLAARLAKRFAQGRRIGTVAAELENVRTLFATKRDDDRVETADPIDWLAHNLSKTDLPFFAGLDAAREAVQRIPALIEGRFLVAIAAHETTFHKREERVAGPVVVGRSVKPHPA